MPTRKQSAKHAAKKSAKHAAKHAKKTAGDHETKALRRAYEHLGRVEAMRHLAAEMIPDSVERLALQAKRYLGAGLAEEGADLLRAAEHLSFSALSPESEGPVDSSLVDAIGEEFLKLSSRAEELRPESKEHDGELSAIFEAMLAGARDAFGKKRYRQALELARGAEALGHVEPVVEGAKKIASGGTRQLRA